MSEILVSEVCGSVFAGDDIVKDLIQRIEEILNFIGADEDVVIDWLGVDVVVGSTYVYFVQLLRRKKLQDYIEYANHHRHKRHMAILLERYAS
jgi:hypothetical protein